MAILEKTGNLDLQQKTLYSSSLRSKNQFSFIMQVCQQQTYIIKLLLTLFGFTYCRLQNTSECVKKRTKGVFLKYVKRKKGNVGGVCFRLLGEKKCRREKISKIEYDCYTFIRKSRVLLLCYILTLLHLQPDQHLVRVQLIGKLLSQEF